MMHVTKFIIEERTQYKGLTRLVEHKEFAAYVENKPDIQGIGDSMLEALVKLDVQLDFLYGDPTDQLFSNPRRN